MKRRKQKPEVLTNLRKMLRDLIFLLCFCILGYGGYDYYENQNVNKTLQMLSKAGGYLKEVPDKAGWLADEANQIFEKISGSYGGTASEFLLDEIPEYSGAPYVVINNNEPVFSKSDLSSEEFEYYSELDSLGRCGLTKAMISTEIMPTEERGQIGMVKPSGWHTVKYDNVDGKYLYNRCHLIAFELAGENANVHNLITGTRYMNVKGMLPWENRIARYVKKTHDKVFYRVTPVFKGNELVARGVHMEAKSVGSNEIRFNIFVYNVQPGIGIDYANGNSWVE